MAYGKARELVQIAFLAASSRGVSLAEIEQALGRTRRTAQRVCVALEAAFPETERIVDEEGFARWKLPRTGVSGLLAPTAEELTALSVAIDELRRASGGTEAGALRSLLAKVRALIPADRGRRLVTDEEALLLAMGHAARPGPRPVVNDTVDAAISLALKGCSHLRIRYRGRGQLETRDRVVTPHGLLLGIRRYLVAVDTAKPDSGLRHYRVEEIVEAEVLPTGFVLDPGFRLDDHAARSFGSYQRDAEYGEVVWRFSPAAAARARQFEFHPGQALAPQDDGSLVVRFPASGLLEMCWYLYAWGDAVEVLAPPALADMVAGHRRGDFASLP